MESTPQGRGVTEAVVYGPHHYLLPSGNQQSPTLETMGLRGATKTQTCGHGYDLVTGLGAPGPAFFRTFG